MIEANSISGWIYRKLAASSIVTSFVKKHPTEKVWNIYDTVALEGATYPMVIYRRLAGRNINGTGGRRIFDSAFYEVVAIDENQTTFALVAPVGNEIDKIFYQEPTTLDDLVASCTSTASVKRIENTEGIRRNVEGVEVSIQAYIQSNG